MSESEYTPTTEEVREYIRAADRVTAHMFAPGADSVEAFDRWLAEVRAGVVTEETEWEYGVRATGDSEPFTDHYESLEAMSEEFDGRMVWNVDEEMVRRRKAGPWTPVQQEGTESDG